jgi:hypothetical protein
MGTFGEKLKDMMERARIVKLWGPRIDAAGMTRASFCEKHKLDEGQLSRWISGTNGPEWTSIENVEKALRAEGV